MTEVRYIGMTFVYPKDRDRWELIKSKAKIVEILVRKYECVSGYYVSKIGGVYLEAERVMGWRYKRDVEYEDIPYFLNEKEYEIVWTESMEKGIEEVWKYEHWERVGKRIECVAFKSFPPKKYLDKHKVVYDIDKPAFPLGQKEGPEVWAYTPELWYTYKGNKDFISLDFGTYEKYFYSEDEKLNKAMEEFLVDLMRDIAKETKPEYAYMDLEEYRPLENDPACENMRELVRFWRREGIYTEGGSMLWIPKELILRDFERTELRKVRSVIGKEWEVVIEEHGKYLFLYPRRRMVGGYGYYVGYRYKNRNKEYEFLKDLKKERIWISGVCGSVDKGLELKIRIDSEDEKEEIIKKIERLKKKHRVNVKDVKFLKKG